MKPLLRVVSAGGLALGLFGVLAGCGGTNSPSQSTVPPAATTAAATPTQAAPAEPTAKATTDPYEVYLSNLPAGQKAISREDAQTRAYLGCNTTFAPGTVDRVLADAYRPTGICGR